MNHCHKNKAESGGDFLAQTGELKENVTSGNRGSEFSASAGGRGNPSIENGWSLFTNCCL